MYKAFSLKSLKTLLAFAMSVSMFVAMLPMTQAQAALSVGATPLKTVLDLDPGASTTFEIKAINRNDQDMKYKVSLLATKGADEFGNATIAEVDTTDDSSLPNWITISNPLIDVPAGEMKPVSFTIKVPEDAAPGGYYGLAIFSPADVDTSAGNVGVVGEIGTPIIVQVNGDITEIATVEKFDLDYASLKDGEPITFAFTVKNAGNVHILPKGEVQLEADGVKLTKVAKIVTPEGAEKVVDYLPINPGNGYTLRDNTRTYLVRWEMNKKYTNIKATYTMSFGKEKIQTLKGENTFSIKKKVEIADFKYGEKEFALKLRNTGNVMMPMRGQINIYSKAGGDPKVTLSFPTNGDVAYLDAGKEEMMNIAWEGLEALKANADNQFYATVTYVTDAENGETVSAQVNLPYDGMPTSPLDGQLPFIIVIGLLVLIILILALRKGKK